MIFEDRWILWLLPLVLLWGARHLSKSRTGGPALLFSDVNLFKSVAGLSSSWPDVLLTGLRLVCVLGLVLALARPRGRGEETVVTEGIDILLAIDVSGSMRTMDFKPLDRLGAAKKVVEDFIRMRQNDRIGMVVFAAESFTQCPLTLDYDVLLSFLDQVQIGMINENATAIGTALAISCERLKNSDAKSKMVILLTDGRNNSGRVDPLTAAQAAKALGIRVYTVGAGSPEGGLIPVDDPIFGRQYVRAENELDEPLLKRIAETTSGQYRRATDFEALKKIYQEISDMEKTSITYTEFTEERFYPWFVGIPLLALFLETVLRQTIYRKIP